MHFVQLNTLCIFVKLAALSWKLIVICCRKTASAMSCERVCDGLATLLRNDRKLIAKSIKLRCLRETHPCHVRRWNLKQTIPGFFLCRGYNYDEKLNWTDKQRYFCNKLSQLKSIPDNTRMNVVIYSGHHII